MQKNPECSDQIGDSFSYRQVSYSFSIVFVVAFIIVLKKIIYIYSVGRLQLLHDSEGTFETPSYTTIWELGHK